jgi:glutathione S-transferase
MSDIILFHCPGACSRVTMNALEEIGLEFEDRAINLLAGQQKSPEYLAVNPKGKVPALKVGDRLHTENAAILYFLDLKHPAAHLLPKAEDGIPPNEGLEDLVWCSSTIHPMVRQVRAPIRFTNGDPEGVKAHGAQHLPAILDQISLRVSNGRWWYGNHWSIVDVYLYWNYSTAAGAGIDLSAWPALLEHGGRVRGRPSFIRSLARENAAVASHGIQLPPGTNL